MIGLGVGTGHKPGKSALLERLLKLLEEIFSFTKFSSLKDNSVHLVVAVFSPVADVANMDESRVKRWRKRQIPDHVALMLRSSHVRSPFTPLRFPVTEPNTSPFPA